MHSLCTCIFIDTSVLQNFPKPLLSCTLQPHSFETLIVEEASARLQMDSYMTLPNSDHITVCKPSAMNAASYVRLKRYLNDQFNKEPKVCVTRRPVSW